MCASVGQQKTKSNRTESKVRDISGGANGLSGTKDWPQALCGHRNLDGASFAKGTLSRCFPNTHCMLTSSQIQD